VRITVVDKSYDLMETWSAPIKMLPGDIFQLLVYVSRDLMEDEKVPLSHHEFSSLEMDAKNMCGKVDLKQLIRPSEDENAEHLWRTYLLPTIHRGPPDENGTDHTSASGTVISEMSLLPLSLKAKLDVYATAIKIQVLLSRDRILPC